MDLRPLDLDEGDLSGLCTAKVTETLTGGGAVCTFRTECELSTLSITRQG